MNLLGPGLLRQNDDGAVVGGDQTSETGETGEGEGDDEIRCIPKVMQVSTGVEERLCTRQGIAWE